MGFKLLKPSVCLFSIASCIFQLPNLWNITLSCITHTCQKLVLAESEKRAVKRKRVYYHLSWISFTVPYVL